MPKMIVDGSIVEDNWQVVAADEFDSLEQLADGKYLLPISAWNQIVESANTVPKNIGIWIASTELPEQIQGDFREAPVIAVEFPVFADGRGFSIGRLLRQRHDYTGELRAIGKPIRDQLSFMIRCGFNAFVLAEHYDPDQALQSLKDFSDSYQSAVDQSVPLFRRRG